MKKKPLLFKEGSLFEKIKVKKEAAIRESIQAYLCAEGIHEIHPLPILPTAELPLHGIVPYTTSEGIIFLGEKKKLFEALPYFLVAAHLDPKRNKIYCLKDKKTLQLNVEPLPLLKKWIAYAAKAKTSPYPFSPSSVEALVKGDMPALKKILEVQGCSQNAETLYHAYKKEAEELFGALLT